MRYTEYPIPYIGKEDGFEKFSPSLANLNDYSDYGPSMMADIIEEQFEKGNLRSCNYE